MGQELIKFKNMYSSNCDEMFQLRLKHKEESDKHIKIKKDIRKEKEELEETIKEESIRSQRDLESALRKIDDLAKLCEEKDKKLKTVFENFNKPKKQNQNSISEPLQRSRTISNSFEISQFQIHNYSPISKGEIISELISKEPEQIQFRLEDFDVETNTPARNGAFGIVKKVINKISKQIYAMKTLTQLSDNLTIEREIGVWEKLRKLKQKPLAIPIFYGYLKQNQMFSAVSYHLFFDYFPKSLKNVIEDIKAKKNETPFPFHQLLIFTERLINGLAFLQTLKICHCDLKPDNLLLDNELNNIYIIDLSESKEILYSCPEETKKEMTVAGSLKYFSPELNQAYEIGKSTENFNPFKSDVFSLGLILLELVTLDIPQKSQDTEIYEKNIEGFLKKFKKAYKNTIQEKEMKDLLSLIEIITISLKVIPKDRMDFIGLYYTFQMKFNPNNQDILRTQILIGEKMDLS